MVERGTASRAEGLSRPPIAGPRLAEAACVLASATDLAVGMPLTSSMRITLTALRIADLLDDDSLDRRVLYYLCLVRLLGCTVEGSHFAAAMGNEFEISKVMAPVDQADRMAMMRMLVGFVGAGEPPLRRARRLMGAMAFGAGMRSVMAGHCEVSRILTEDLHLGRDVAHALDNTYERWDGKGAPKGVRGEAIPLPARVMHCAYQALAVESLIGREVVRDTFRKRAGGWFDPRVANIVVQHTDDVLDAAQVESPWDAVLDAEPGGARALMPEQIDCVAVALSSFCDLKADHLAGHSSGVARLTREAAELRGMQDDELADVHRAALFHDLGRVGISSLVWDKPGPLDDDEWEEVRLHAYHTERVVERAPWLSRAARIAGAHHERLDGSGYHRGSGAPELSGPTRLLAAAACYRSLTEARPYRAAYAPDEAARILQSEGAAGRLDREAVQCVLEAAGHAVPAAKRELPAGLTQREAEILRLISSGSTIKQVAAQLGVSPKTVDAHVQHIYNKVGCGTRAGAAVFAMQQGLLDPPF